MPDGMNRVVQMPVQMRAAPVRTVQADKRTVTVMWSAGGRVVRYDFWEDEHFIEELDMSPDACDLSRLRNGAPVLNTHSRGSLADVMGVVEDPWLEAGQGYANLRFSERDDVEPYWRDVRDGIIRAVSVGYEIFELKEMGRDKKTGYRVLRAVRWQPFEISLVPVGAEAVAGTRDAPAATSRCEVHIEQLREVQPAAQSALIGANQMAEVQDAAAPVADVKVIADNTRDNRPVAELEQQRKKAIENFCKANNLDVRYASRWIADGSSLEKVSEEILKILEERGKDNPASVADIGLTAREVEQFSLFRMIGAVQSGNYSKAGFEKRCHEAVAAQVQEKLGRGASAENNFFVPAEVLKAQVMRRRDLTAIPGSAGGFLVETANVSFIELLRNRSVLFNMGARRLSGLVGNVAIPKQTGAATANWMNGEDGTGVSYSDQVFGQLAMSPKTVVAGTKISRQLQLQSDPSAESIVMMDLAAQVSLAMDSAGLTGTGAASPIGVINTTGIGGFTGTNITYALLLNSQEDLALANTLSESCGYVSHPTATTVLMTKSRFANTDTPLWEGNMLNGTCIGFRAMTSNQMPSARVLFGDFSQIIVGEWGVLELAVNPTENFLAGIIGLRAMYSCDIGVRYPAAFSYASNDVTT